MRRYGFIGEAHRVAEGILDAAARSTAACPSCSAGSTAPSYPPPFRSRPRCSPQAWAAAAPVLLLRACSASSPGSRSARSAWRRSCRLATCRSGWTTSPSPGPGCPSRSPRPAPPSRARPGGGRRPRAASHRHGAAARGRVMRRRPGVRGPSHGTSRAAPVSAERRHRGVGAQGGGAPRGRGPPATSRRRRPRGARGARPATSSGTSRVIVRFGMSISIASPSSTRRDDAAGAASGETCPIDRPEVPPEKRPSVISAHAFPSPRPLR